MLLWLIKIKSIHPYKQQLNNSLDCYDHLSEWFIADVWTLWLNTILNGLMAPCLSTTEDHHHTSWVLHLLARTIPYTQSIRCVLRLMIPIKTILHLGLPQLTDTMQSFVNSPPNAGNYPIHRNRIPHTEGGDNWTLNSNKDRFIRNADLFSRLLI